ncbi:hypothetical protein [Corynebacterium durum]|jgi:hypothetical protein|uniref:Bacterial transferase hexapeptide repeat protein n=1 Tax=Corynebacterium durum F0235 TaxID=1035195 RepID=L1MD53_9CORY|nr:hypothetical protein [Corynebacterium durum]EKX88955.1 bacterial transferase hexapeptide repeat protein [Corynebacterium durum F0235]
MARKHFELTDCTQRVGDRVLHRIRATRDLPRHGVDKGMLGGWVEHSTCLAGDAWVDDDARVFRNAKVYGQALAGEDALIADQAKVYGDAVVVGDARVMDQAKVLGKVELSECVQVRDHARIRGDTWIEDFVQFTGDMDYSGGPDLQGFRPDITPRNNQDDYVPGEPYFRLVGHARKIEGVLMKRVKAIRNLPHAGVVKGDVGGWVEKESNLADGAWVADDAKVYGDAVLAGEVVVFEQARVCDRARVTGRAKVWGSAVICGDAQVRGDAVVCGQAYVCGKAQVGSDDERACVCDCARVAGRARVLNCARVYGNAEVTGSAVVSSFARVFSDARVRARAKVQDRARIFGTTILAGAVRVGGNAEICADVTLSDTKNVTTIGDYLEPFYESATLIHTGDGPDDHLLRVGLWQGTVDEFAARIEELPASWSANGTQRRTWRAEYKKIEKAARALTSRPR